MGYILLTEDDALLIRLYQKKLSHDGFEVRTAENGLEALALVKKEEPDLILLDIMMPKMNGLEVLKKMKDDPKTKSIPIIVLSNMSGGNDPDVALEMGAAAYLVKSDNPPDVVVAKVKEILAATNRGRDVPKAVPTGS